MRIIKFDEAEGRLILKLEVLEDLWSAQRIIFRDDVAKSKSLRRFKPSEGDEGELKEVFVSLRVERTELDKTAERLRITGKILEGRPIEYVRIGSYHTLNIGLDDVLEIQKAEWHRYMVDVIRNAVSMSKKPKLGILAIDDEKAQPAYLLGYGIEFKNEVYNGLSKRMSNKEFAEQEQKYFTKLMAIIEEMPVSTVIIAGPGFTKDELKKRMEDSGFLKRSSKRFIYMNISNAERSGVYELIKSKEMSSILERERIRQEFLLMDEFLKGLAAKRSRHGAAGVAEAIANYEAEHILVNDGVLSDPEIQRLLNLAEAKHLRVEVINTDDEVGAQLASFENVACF